MGVLIVDDHALFAGALRVLLELNGYEVVGTAGDGLEAVERVRSLRPDLVLMDLCMPRCDGLAATRRIKAEFPDMKVVILTASEEEDDLLDAVRCGASGYVPKVTAPSMFFDLLARVT